MAKTQEVRVTLTLELPIELDAADVARILTTHPQSILVGHGSAALRKLRVEEEAALYNPEDAAPTAIHEVQYE